MGRTSPASSPATAPIRSALAPASRPSAHIVSLKVLDDRGRGVISDVIAALDWVGREQGRLQRARRQPVGRRGGHRVLQDRPADARGQARRRRRHRRRHCGRQPREERRRADAVRRHHGSRQRAVGADRRRVQPRGHGGAYRRRDGRLQLARSDGDRLRRRSRTSSRRARASSRCRSATSTMYCDEAGVPAERLALAAATSRI